MNNAPEIGPANESAVALAKATQKAYRARRTPAPLIEGMTRLTRWSGMETWSAHEAALLVCGFDPSTYQEMTYGQRIPRATGLCGGTFWGVHSFAEVRLVQEAWNRKPTVSDRTRPSEFIAWCKARDINTDWLRDIDASIVRVPQPKQRSAAWDAAVLAALVRENFDPKRLPRTPTGKASPGKQAARTALVRPDGLTDAMFNHAWKRLRAAREIAES